MFFNALCSKFIDLEIRVMLKKSTARTLCEMEKIYLP